MFSSQNKKGKVNINNASAVGSMNFAQDAWFHSISLCMLSEICINVIVCFLINAFSFFHFDAEYFSAPM